jgi:fucose permease
VKAIGSLSGPVIPVVAARWFGVSWKVIFPIYAVAILVTLLAVSGLKVDEKRSKDRPATLGSCFRLLGNGYVFAMVMTIFLYVGAEVCVSSGIPLFLKQNYNVDVNSSGLLGTGLFFLALTIGRFSGGVILSWIPARTFFIVTSFVSIVALAGLFVPDKSVAVVSFFLAGLGFANIFPLAFSLTVESLPQYTNELSGLMVTAIVGGAILPPLMGLVSDSSSVLIGFLVPMAAVAYITWTAFLNATPRARVVK